MARSAEQIGRAPAHRSLLTRQRKNLRLELPREDYDKLVKLASCGEDGRPRSLVSVVQGLIRDAQPSGHA